MAVYDAARDAFLYMTGREVNECPAGLWNQLQGPEPPAVFVSNGCSVSPDKIGGRTHRVACHWHDWPYSNEYEGPRTFSTRLQADQDLRQNIILALTYQGMSETRARARAWLYYQGVRRLGMVGFYKDGYPADDMPPGRIGRWIGLGYNLLRKVI